ncbi:hypothetical protein [Deinococcus sp. UR1]|uniref:hypothetical protein n=1 Tax=Deinococcus sp. UR1 TaxID=1704277 RepID=UPI000C193D38|nr:hypothetical protein [Deinococcus sp. UR1]PIG96858.1 hypothetical protein AMD26_015110 [Deinococcus sp. UR1]
MDNPTLSALITARRENPYDTEDARLMQEASAQAARNLAAQLTSKLQQQGEPEPTVRALPNTVIGDVAEANIAGYPILQRNDGLYLMSRPGDDHQPYLHALSGITSVATRGDARQYVSPADYTWINPRERAGRIVHVDHAEAERNKLQHAKQVHEQLIEARAAHTQLLANTFTPLQLELANAPYQGEVTYFDWLSATLCNRRTPPNLARLQAVQLIKSLRP